MPRPVRAALAGLSVVAALAVALVLPAGAAEATAYRFWGYYELKGTTWAFAPQGPEATKPADGAVEGWRFAVADESETRAPRVSPTFEEVCGATKTSAGNKRVAVVVDFGRAADGEDGSAEPPAPTATCAAVREAASGAEVLANVAAVRTQTGLVCAVAGYPATGCGGQVKAVSEAAAAPDTPVTLAGPTASTSSAVAATADSQTAGGGLNAGSWVGIGIALLAAAGVALAVVLRRGRH